MFLPVLQYFVGAFIIQNTFRILLLQRTKELSSLLRALGTSKRQIYRLVISESLFMSVIGSGLGIGLGIGLAVAVKEGLQYFEFGLPDGPLVLTSEAAITGLIIGVLPLRSYLLFSLLERLRKSVPWRLSEIASQPQDENRYSLRLVVGVAVSVTWVRRCCLGSYMTF